MLTRILDYKTDGRPSDDDILEAIKIARFEKCVVRIHWKDQPYGPMILQVNAGMSLTDCKRNILKKYT